MKAVRHAIRADVAFLVPAFFAYTAGALLSAWDIIEREKEAPATPEENALGLLLVFPGAALAVAAAITLRKNYSSTLRIRQGHELIVHGVYRHVRHPVYLGALMVSWGIPIYAESLYGFLVMLLLIPCFLYRIRIEERMMLEQFGTEYREYMDGTKRLVPLLY